MEEDFRAAGNISGKFSEHETRRRRGTNDGV